MADPLLGMGLPLLLVLAGTALMLAEAVIPGAQFVVVGVAMLLAGVVGLVLGGVFASIVALSVMTLAFGVFAYFAFREMELYNGPNRGQTSDSDDLSGNLAVVTERVDARGGVVRLKDGGGFDPNYRARTNGDPIEEGEEVIVTDPGGGNVLTVQATGILEEDSIDRALARGRESGKASTTAPPTSEEVATDEVDDDDGSDEVVPDGEGDDTDDGSDVDESADVADDETETERA